jgi:hypothetical protein
VKVLGGAEYGLPENRQARVRSLGRQGHANEETILALPLHACAAVAIRVTRATQAHARKGRGYLFASGVDGTLRTFGARGRPTPMPIGEHPCRITEGSFGLALETLAFAGKKGTPMRVAWSCRITDGAVRTRIPVRDAGRDIAVTIPANIAFPTRVGRAHRYAGALARTLAVDEVASRHARHPAPTRSIPAAGIGNLKTRAASAGSTRSFVPTDRASRTISLTSTRTGASLLRGLARAGIEYACAGPSSARRAARCCTTRAARVASSAHASRGRATHAATPGRRTSSGGPQPPVGPFAGPATPTQNRQEQCASLCR